MAKILVNYPKISVCIPAFNAESTIRSAIKSVLTQSFENFEIIVIDNASTDNTFNTVKSINDSRIKVYKNDENIGYPANVNKCLSSSRGEYITILCADDYFLHPDVLGIWVKALIENQDCVAVHSPFTHPLQDYSSSDHRKAYTILKEGRNSPRDVIGSFMSGKGFFGWGWLLRSELVTKNGIRFDESLTMAPDTLFWLEVSMQGNVFETPVNVPAYAFVVHPNSLGTKLFVDFSVRVFNELLEFEKKLVLKLEINGHANLLMTNYTPARYTCNECLCILKNNYLKSNISWAHFMREALKLIAFAPLACANLRFLKNLIMGFLPRATSIFARRLLV